MKNIFKILFISALALVPQTLFAVELPNYRVHYKEDGSVLITHFLAEACKDGESEKECMDRIMTGSGLEHLPYDDVPSSEIAKLDRADRDKWRGKKGEGIHVDTTLVSKRDKVVAYQEELNVELDKAEPNASRVLKLQRLIEQVNELPNPILSKDEIKQFDMKRKGIVARAVAAVADAVSGAVDSLRASVAELAQVFTGRLQVGTPTAPTGITVYDIDTGEPSCIVVRSGRLESTAGECANVSGNVISNSAIIKDPLEQPPPLNGGEIEPVAEPPVELGADSIQDLLDQQPVTEEAPVTDILPVEESPVVPVSEDVVAPAPEVNPATGGETAPPQEELSP